MTIEEQLSVAQQAEQLWRLLMPELEVPGPETFAVWARHPVEMLRHGINRAASKARKMRGINQPMSANDAARYCSSVLRNESLGVRNPPAQEGFPA